MTKFETAQKLIAKYNLKMKPKTLITRATEEGKSLKRIAHNAFVNNELDRITGGYRQYSRVYSR